MSTVFQNEKKEKVDCLPLQLLSSLYADELSWIKRVKSDSPEYASFCRNASDHRAKQKRVRFATDGDQRHTVSRLTRWGYCSVVGSRYGTTTTLRSSR